MRRRLLLILAALVLVVLGTGIAVLLTRHPPGGTLETNVTDVTVVTPSAPVTTTAPPPTPTPTPKPPAAGTVTPKTKLVLTSGPGFTITLKTAAGKTVKRMKTGTYRIVVRDRGRIHNAHVIAPGFNRKTSLTYTGTQTWKAKLARPGTFRFLCDPHALSGMKGSARIVR